MKKFVKYSLIGIVGLAAIGAMVPDPETVTSTTSVASELSATGLPETGSLLGKDKQDLAKEIAKEEIKVLSMSVNGNTWEAKLKDDGTRRDGYAMYLCEVLREKNMVETTTSVVIIDNANGSILGSSGCAL